jgi:uncharacterized Ntn-hydrolase superfamily protein
MIRRETEKRKIAKSEKRRIGIGYNRELPWEEMKMKGAEKSRSLAALGMTTLFIFLLVISAGPVGAQQAPTITFVGKPGPLAHTFSIVARDAQTGEIGAAVQSHWFAVGQQVIWAEAGVGAVATQSFVDPSYGPLGLDLMRAGKSAPEALDALLGSDPNNQVRQVAMIDSRGNVSVFTGCMDISQAGHSVSPVQDKKFATRLVQSPNSQCKSKQDYGFDFAVQANLMSNDKVWPAMAKAFQEAKGDLAERMLAALDAGQAAGGDIRGRQSAALIVVKAKSSGKPWEDRIFDLRVDDADYPLKELRRLVALQRAYNHMNAGDLAVEHKDNELALKEYSTAEEIASKTDGVLPSRLAEMMYWHAVALVNMGRVDESLPLFKKVFAIDKNWATLTRRLPKSSLLPNDPKLIDRIVEQNRERSQ